MSLHDSVQNSDLDTPWWTETTQKAALPKLSRLFRYYADHDKDRMAAYTGYSRLYLNRDIFGNDYLKNYSAAFKALDDLEYSRAPLNVAKVMTDAVHARLTRPAVAIEFLPTGGNWSLRTRAKMATQFIAHQTHKCNLRHQESVAMLDALIYGLGAIKTCPHPAVAEVENYRVHPRDIFVDPYEAAAHGNPSHLYQRQFVSRGRLQKLFPSRAARIREAGRITDRTDSGTDWATDTKMPMANLVEVVEAWKLPSWPGAGDGKHAVFVDGTMLSYESWEAPDFPFSFVRWKDDPTVGFFGVSLVEELIGLHFDINTSIVHTEKAIEMMPKPFITVPMDGEVNEGSLGNIPGIIINHTGRAPEIKLNQSVPGDVVNYVEVQWQRALQVSRLVALSIPEQAGSQAETGAALDTVVDIQSTELAPAFKNREDFNVRLGEQQLIAGRQLDQRLRKNGKKGFRTVVRKDRNTVLAVDWSQFDLDPRDDSYVVQAEPASALGHTFGQKLAQVKEMLSIGLIPLSRAFKLLDVPDLQSEMRIQNASLDFIERVMEEILDEGKYTAPEPTMDLRLAFKVAQKYINLAQAMDVEDDRVTLLYDFLRGVNALIQDEQTETRNQAAGLTPGPAGSPPALDITGGAPGAQPVGLT